MFWSGFGGFVRSDDDGTPVGINVAVGAVAVTAATFLAARLPVADAAGRCAVVALVLGAFALITVDPAAVLFLLPAAWMIMNGFLVNGSGDLSWHGPADLYRFLVLTGVGAFGLVLGELTRQIRETRDRRRLGAVVGAMATEFDEEASHRA